jgi:hypothetical protein
MATYNCLTAQDYRYQASQVANELEGKMARWKQWADQLATVTAEDFTALGLSEAEQTQMGSMRSLVNVLVTMYFADGAGLTNGANLRTFIRRHAQLLLLTQ